MINFSTISFKNFMSYGNVTSIVSLNREGTVLIKGENLDDTTNGVGSNGVGKSTIINALSYVLYDKPLSEVSTKDKLINNINGKDMIVTVDFDKNGKHYHIERGRKVKGKGNFVQILESEKDITPDSIQNSNDLIERIIGLPHDLFTRIVVFSALNKSFLELPTKSASGANQTEMIEHLFGLTLLSQKAEALKDHIKDTQNKIDGEKVHIEHLEKEKIRYEEQVKNAVKRVEDWDFKRKEDIKKLNQSLLDMDKISFDEQIDFLKKIENIDSQIKETEYTLKELNIAITDNENRVQKFNLAEKRINDWQHELNSSIIKYSEELEKLSSIDTEEQKNLLETLSLLENDINICEKALKEFSQNINKWEAENKEASTNLSHLEDERCPFCLQEFKEAQKKIITFKDILINNKKSIEQTETDISELKTAIESLKENVKDTKKKIVVKNRDEVINIENKKKTLSNKLIELKTTQNPHIDSFNELKKELEKNPILNSEDIDLLKTTLKNNKEEIDKLSSQKKDIKSKLIFDKLEDLLEVKNNKSNISNKISEKEKEINPYLEPLKELEKSKVDEIDYQKINELNKFLEHQKFLQKLLTKKDSFVRKILLDKYLPFLNIRLQKYIEDIGLPHKVEFTNDLSARIVHFNRELDFGNLSNGQRARVNIALSFAFRDVLQQLHTAINICILDEVLDQGLDSVGVQMTAAMLKKKAKEEKISLFIITHKQEIETTFENILVVQMCDNFSQIKETICT